VEPQTCRFSAPPGYSVARGPGLRKLVTPFAFIIPFILTNYYQMKSDISPQSILTLQVHEGLKVKTFISTPP
jgi:hypothetical protein